MPYWISTIYNISLLITCSCLMSHVFSRFSHVQDRLASLGFADAQMLSCANRKAAKKNLEDANLFIKKQRPDLSAQLSLLKNELLESFAAVDELTCTHPYFAIAAASRKQGGSGQQEFWPNWVFSLSRVSL